MGGVDEYCTLTLLKAVHHMANAPRLVLLLAQGKLLGTETVEMLFYALAHMLPQHHTHEIEAVRAWVEVVEVGVERRCWVSQYTALGGHLHHSPHYDPTLVRGHNTSTVCDSPTLKPSANPPLARPRS